MEFRDLNKQYLLNKKEIDHAIQDVLDQSRFIGGATVTGLEKRLAEYVDVKHCITCANGTEAMTIVLMAWNIGPGDAVFVPDFTFFSTGEVVALCGATPVFVDVNEDTFNIDPMQLKKAVENVVNEGKLKPKVVIPVDLFGLPAKYSEIQKIADQYAIRVLEDGAQGFGGSINGRMACSFGDAATTSFFPAKPLGCYGDGGAIFTNDTELAELINSLKVHGKGHNKYDNVRIGLNSRLDTIQASILDVKLTAFISTEVEAVRNIAEIYNAELAGIVKTPLIPDLYMSSYAQYTIQVSDELTRDRIKKALTDADIPSMIYYAKPMHEQKAFDNLVENSINYSVASHLSKVVLSLPMHPYMNEDDVVLICDELKNAIE